MFARTLSTLPFRTLFLVFSCASLSAGNANAAKLLRWKLEEGETIHVRFVQDMTMEASQIGKSTADMAMDMKWVVQDVEQDGTYLLRQSIERLRMKIHAPGIEEIEYDTNSEQNSDSPVIQNLSQSLQPLVGIEFVQNMSDRGEILDVRLSPRDQAKLEKQPANAQLRQIFSKDGLKALLSQAATVLPQGPIQPGHRWQGTTETRSPMGNMHLDLLYTYKGTEVHNGRPLERIDVRMSIRFGDEVKALGLQIDVKDQKNWGTMYFDAKAGRFVETVMNQNMTLETSLGAQTHSQKLDTVLRMQFVDARAQRDGQVGLSQAPRDGIPVTPVSQTRTVTTETAAAE